MPDDITSKTDEEILRLIPTLEDYPSGTRLAIEAELNRRGIARRVHGTVEGAWALATSAALAAIEMTRETGTAVLQITAYDRASGRIAAADSWMSQRNWGESARYYASRSQRDAKLWITSYPDSNVVFVLTFKDPDGTAIPSFVWRGPAESILLTEKIGYLVLASCLALALAFPYPPAYQMAVVFAPMFPLGLLIWITLLGISLSDEAGLLIGYGTYAVFAVIALSAPDRRRFFRVFWIICGLLAVNVGGCHWIAYNIHRTWR